MGFFFNFFQYGRCVFMGGNCKIFIVWTWISTVLQSWLFFFNFSWKWIISKSIFTKKQKLINIYVVCMYMIIGESISVYAAWLFENKLKSISFIFFYFYKTLDFEILSSKIEENFCSLFCASISRLSSVIWSNGTLQK